MEELISESVELFNSLSLHILDRVCTSNCGFTVTFKAALWSRNRNFLT
jgi:hypothetical protein